MILSTLNLQAAHIFEAIIQVKSVVGHESTLLSTPVQTWSTCMSHTSAIESYTCAKHDRSASIQEIRRFKWHSSCTSYPMNKTVTADSKRKSKVQSEEARGPQRYNLERPCNRHSENAGSKFSGSNMLSRQFNQHVSLLGFMRSMSICHRSPCTSCRLCKIPSTRKNSNG